MSHKRRRSATQGLDERRHLGRRGDNPIQITGDARAGSERILANRGTLRVDEKNPLLFTARSDGLAFSSKDVGTLTQPGGGLG